MKVLHPTHRRNAAHQCRPTAHNGCPSPTSRPRKHPPQGARAQRRTDRRTRTFARPRRKSDNRRRVEWLNGWAIRPLLHSLIKHLRRCGSHGHAHRGKARLSSGGRNQYQTTRKRFRCFEAGTGEPTPDRGAHAVMWCPQVPKFFPPRASQGVEDVSAVLEAI